MLNHVRASRPFDGPAERVQHCPVCQQDRLFLFIGVQSWPHSHRHRRDLPPDLALWECDQCEASISTELLKEPGQSH
ncbi:MAG TPA: hypothetical protein PLQ56_04550 [Aggregatilineales bacterium]|nr:hypothetical protein [Anaerolineae bacterium]HUN05841.1 hypothetical protein [Aggregatilineales bacterium]